MKSKKFYLNKLLELTKFDRSLSEIIEFNSILEKIKFSRDLEIIKKFINKENNIEISKLLSLESSKNLLLFLEECEEYEKCFLVKKFIQNNY